MAENKQMEEPEFPEGYAYYEDGSWKWITLELDNGKEIECAVLGIFRGCNHRNYIAVVEQSRLEGFNPDADDLENLEPYIYHYAEDENGDPVLDNITDDDEWDIACDAYEEMLANMVFDEMVKNER